MKLGIFHKVFEPQTLEQSLDGACAAGLVAVQLDLTAAGMDPAELSVEDGVRIRTAHPAAGSAKIQLPLAKG